MPDGTKTTELQNSLKLAQQAVKAQSSKTYTALSKEIGISATSVSSVARGVETVSVATLKKVLNWAYPFKPAPPPVPIHPPESDIRELVSAKGDQKIKCAAGVYPVGDNTPVVAAHPVTDGPYRGCVVLEAEHPGECVIDMSKGGLTLDAGSRGVVLLGFKQINGMFISRGDDIVNWYPDASYPAEEWERQFEAVGGSMTGTPDQKKAAILRMANPLPKGFWIGEESVGRILKRNVIAGADIHECGDDGVFVDHSQYPMLLGFRIWDISEGKYDPGVNPWGGTSDLWHNDGVQIPGNVTDAEIGYGWAQQGFMLGGDNADTTGLNMHDLWLAGCPGTGMVVASQNGKKIQGTMKNILAWGNGAMFKSDPGWNLLRTDILPGKQSYWPNTLNGGPISVGNSGNVQDHTSPDGPFPGYMADPLSPKDDARNPALVWRKAWPFESWQSFLRTIGLAA